MANPVPVQWSTPTQFTTMLGGSAPWTRTTVFGSNPTAGNTIVVFSTHADGGSTGGNVSFSDAVNGAYTDDYHSYHSSSLAQLNWASFANIAVSTPKTITMAYSSGVAANQQGILVAVELSGCGGFDQGASTVNAGGTTPASGSTGTLSVANSIVLASMLANTAGALTGQTIPPTGGPGVYTDSSSSFAGPPIGDLAYQRITGSTVAVSAAWGTISPSSYWLAGVAVYKAASTANYGLLLSSNSGGF